MIFVTYIFVSIIVANTSYSRSNSRYDSSYRSAEKAAYAISDFQESVIGVPALSEGLSENDINILNRAYQILVHFCKD